MKAHEYRKYKRAKKCVNCGSPRGEFVSCDSCREKQMNKHKYKYQNDLEYRERTKKNRKETYWRKNPQKRMFDFVKSRARREGLEFNLELEDMQLPNICPVLGIKIIPHMRGVERSDNTPSVDRIDNTKGYVRGNVDIISWRANRLKNSASPEESIKIAKYVLDRMPELKDLL